MRKFIFITLITALIAGGIYYYWKESRFDVEDVIPRDPIAYLHVKNVKNNWEVVRKSPVWQKIAQINYDALLKNKSLPEESKAILLFVKNSVDQSLDNPVFDNLFSREVAVAVYPTNLTFMASADMASLSMPLVIRRLMANVFLVTRVSPKIQAIDYFTQSLNINDAEYTIASFEYKKHTIYSFTSKESQLTYGAVVIKDLLVVGIGTLAPQRAVDVSFSSELPLSKDSAYTKMRSINAGSDDLFIYSNLQEVFDIVNRYSKNMLAAVSQGSSSEIGKFVDEIIGRMRGMIGASFALGIQKSQMVTNIFFDKEQIKTEFSSFYLKCQPQKNGSAAFIPRDFTVYQWQGCLDFQEIWNTAIKEVAKNKSLPQEDGWKTLAGINIEKELLPVLGDEIGGYLKDIQAGGLFPIPRFVFFVKVKDAGLMNDNLRRMAEETLFGTQTENYGEYKIEYVKTPLGDMFKPAYANIGNYLLISPSDELIKQSIDAVKDPSKSFAADQSLRRIEPDLDNPSTFIQVIKLASLIKQMKSVIEFTNNWVTAQDRQNEAARAGMTQKITDLRAQTTKNVEEIRSLEKDKHALEDEVWNLESQAQNAGGKKEQLVQIKDKITQLQTAVDSSNKEEKEFLAATANIPQNTPAAVSRRLALDEAVYPLLDGLESFQTVTVRSTLEEQVFRTVVHFSAD